MMTPEFFEECSQRAVEAAGTASRVLLSVIAASDEELNIESKKDGSLVSDADYASQIKIASILLQGIHPHLDEAQ